MARRIKWTETAWCDLDAVASYIARDSANYAATFVREVRNAARSLASLAERGRIVPEFDSDSVRELFVGNYRLIYRVDHEIVYILGLIHGARDLLHLWQREKLD